MTDIDGDKMDRIEAYQARIFAALDKISRLEAQSATNSKGDDRVRERDAALIEELEATLAEERADIEAERREVQALKGRLAAAENECQTASAARLSAESRLAQAEKAQVEAETALAQSKSAATEANTRMRAAEAARGQAEARLHGATSDPIAESAGSDPMQDVKIDRLKARIESQDVQFQRLKSANAQLRESVAILRDRNAEFLPDADAIDQSMRAELESLRSTRAADVDEMDTILQELKPLVEGQIHV